MALIIDRFSRAIREPNPSVAIDGIKQEVINEIQSVDERVKIRRTDYFNHTYVPDLVLRWPDSPTDRPLYMRSDSRADYIAEDLETVAEQNPIIFALDGGESISTQMVGFYADPKYREVLITSPAALERVTTERNREPAFRLASSALLQGGRGVVRDSQVAGIGEAMSAGLQAVQRTDSQSTVRAQRVFDEYLDTPRSSRISTFLKTMWVGAGGNEADFPGLGDISGSLDSAALSYLVQLDEIADPDFWTRVGRSLSVDVLRQVETTFPNKNFDQLVRSNLDVLIARICRLVSVEPRFDVNPGELRWVLDHGFLALESPDFIAYVAERIDEMTISPQRRDGVSIDRLRARTQRYSIPLAELGLTSHTRSVAYSTQLATDLTSDEALTKISEALGGPTVTSAVARFPNEPDLTVDFESRTVNGRTTSIISLWRLVRSAISLLTDSTSESDYVFALGDRPAPPSPQQGTLF